MSDHGKNHEAEFEQQDISVKSVLMFFAGLAVMLICAYLAVMVLHKGLTRYDDQHQPQQNPLAADVSTGDERRVMDYDKTQKETIPAKFPEPRLEEDERRELREVREPNDELLASYGVDEKSGVVRIPIERAMQLIVERGLPTRPQMGTAPTSTVNVAKVAADKADHSAATKKSNKK
jgi:hypothetical protein